VKVSPTLNSVHRYQQWINCAYKKPSHKLYRQAQTILATYDELWKNPTAYIDVPKVLGDGAEFGVLWCHGYSVSVEHGIKEERQRHFLLEKILAHEVAPLISNENHQSWGKPNSLKRLNKMISQIAYFLKQNGIYPNKNRVALSRWRIDLAYLQEKRRRTF